MDARPAGSGRDDAGFVGSIPDIYERLLVPLIFAEPAEVLADAVAALAPAEVLETAAGTGVLTRALQRRLPDASIIATDLNEDMLVEGRAREGVGSRVRWQQGDAQALSFDDASFDVVTCQFGVMFLDREAAYAEACRVLRPHGTFAFNVWDAIEHNEYAEAVTDALAAAAPAGSVQFLRRTPHGYHDPDRIQADLTHAGFSVLSLEHHDGTSTGTPLDVALAYCRGTPLSGEIERHPDLDLDSATRIARDALEQRYGAGPTAAQTRWLQVLAVRPG